jgi:hypothetical protein
MVICVSRWEYRPGTTFQGRMIEFRERIFLRVALHFAWIRLHTMSSSTVENGGFASIDEFVVSIRNCMFWIRCWDIWVPEAFGRLDLKTLRPLLGVHSGHDPHVEHTDQTAESDCLAKITQFCQPQLLNEILLPRCGELQTDAQRGNESISEEQ